LSGTWQPPVFIDLGETRTELPAKPEFSTPVMMPEPVPGQDQGARLDAADDQGRPEASNPFPTWFAERIAAANNGQETALWLPALITALLAFLIGAAVVDMFHFVGRQFHTSFLLGLFFLALATVIAVATLRLSWRAWQQLVALRQVVALQREGHELLHSRQYGRASAYLGRIAQLYTQRRDMEYKLNRFFLTAEGVHHDEELCRLFSSQVMRDLDQEALRVISKHANQTALLIMLSPFPFMSMLITLWRTLTMVRAVATLYGGRPGMLGGISLFVLAVQNLLYADVSETLADSSAEALGGGMMAVFSAQLAQGLGSGLLTARVGLRAMEVCRPLPFYAEDRPRVQALRGELLTSLKQWLKGRG